EWIRTEHWHAFLNKDHSLMTWYCGGKTGIFQSESLSQIIDQNMHNILQAFPDVLFPKGLNPLNCKEHLFAHYDQPVAISWIHEEFSKGGYSNYAPGTFDFFNTFIRDYDESVRKVF